ncbi:MAG: hypothetical protein ACM3VZ_12055 [Acidobacteriota bacterium]
MAKDRYFLWLVGMVCGLPHSAVFAQQYQYLNLGNGSVSAINNAGRAVGSLFNSSGTLQAVQWDNGAATFLSSSAASSSAYAINNAGQVAGQSWPRAYVWSNGAVTSLAIKANYGIGSAVGINDSGLVVGNVEGVSSNWPSAVVWNGFDVTPLSNAGGTRSFVTGINNSGLISGYIYGLPGTENPQAAIWQGSSVTLLPNLRPTNGMSKATAVNNNGVAVGTSIDSSGTGYAIAWENGELTRLKNLSRDDLALGISDLGLVVGQMNANGGSAHAALWDPKSGLGIDLNAFVAPGVIPKGITLVSATGVNNSGDIVGTFYDKATGNFGAYELLAVPEAGTQLMWGIGLFALFLRSRRVRSCKAA